jgi:hypothetical protein
MPLRSQPPTASRQYLIWVGAAPRAALGAYILRWQVAASGGGWQEEAMENSKGKPEIG